MVLIPGHLVLFDITNSVYGLQHASKTVNLAGAYIYSGVLAAMDFPILFNPQPVPRRYQDGLETDDSDLATTIIIR